MGFPPGGEPSSCAETQVFSGGESAMGFLGLPGKGLLFGVGPRRGPLLCFVEAPPVCGRGTANLFVGVFSPGAPFGGFLHTPTPP